MATKDTPDTWLKVEVTGEEESLPDDPHSNVGEPLGSLRIKEEVLDDGYGDGEQLPVSGHPEGPPLCDFAPGQNGAIRHDPAVVEGLKIELDVAEEPAVEGRLHDCVGEERESSDEDGAGVFYQSDPTAMDLATVARMTDVPSGACSHDTLLRDSPVRRIVLKGYQPDHEPWCVIKMEAVTESESDAEMDAVTRCITKNGARAVFNQDKGGRANLELFLGVENGEKRYFCPEPGCGKSYTRGDHLKIHALVHTGERPYRCPDPSCGKAFGHPFVLKEHVRTHSAHRPFQCTEVDCGRSFRDRSNFRKHQLMHSGEKPVRRRKPPKKPEKKPYLCPEAGCGRAFSRPSVLQDHVKRHVGEKPFCCSEPGCGKAFLKKAALVMHVRMHTGERPFSCPEPGCGKSFVRKEHLKDHGVTHTGRKPFPCSAPGCGRSFAQKIKLSYHLRTHTGEKPYRCPEPGCGKSYTQNKHLRYHMRSHSGVQPFPCLEAGCERAFDRPSHLARHCLKSHRGRSCGDLAAQGKDGRTVDNSGHEEENR